MCVCVYILLFFFVFLATANPYNVSGCQSHAPQFMRLCSIVYTHNARQTWIYKHPLFAANIIHRSAYKIVTISISSFDNFFDFYGLLFFLFIYFFSPFFLSTTEKLSVSLKMPLNMWVYVEYVCMFNPNRSHIQHSTSLTTNNQHEFVSMVKKKFAKEFQYIECVG